mgnify:CR=1 FL=1
MFQRFEDKFRTPSRRHIVAVAKAIARVSLVMGLLLAGPQSVTAGPPAHPNAAAAAQRAPKAAAQAQPAPQRPVSKSFICPLCGGHAHAIGHDGKPSPRRYSDLEVPTRAYTNLVVACPKCGYAAWSQDFESRVSGAAQQYTRRYLAKTAKRAAQSPLLAYQHHMNLLHVRRASLNEQIGAALFYTYVLKRGRPYGGMDPKLERKVQKARTRALALLTLALKRDPPSDRRAALEWDYLKGELTRLTGDPKAALPYLQKVCWARKQAGYTVGRLACQMTERAKRGESWEDYRDGGTDVRQIPMAEQRALATAARTAKEEKARQEAAAAAKKQAEAEDTKQNQTRGAQAPAVPRAPASRDPYAPAPPPVVK